MIVLIFSLISITCSVALLFIGIQVFACDRKNPINRSFLLYCLVAAMLAFFEFMARQAVDPSRGALWINLQQAAPLAAIASLHFVLEYVKATKRGLKLLLYTLLYLPFLIYLFFLIFTDYFALNAVSAPWGFAHGGYKNPGLAGYIPAAWMIVLSLASIIIAFFYYIAHKQNSLKSGTFHVFIAMLLPFLGATIQNAVLKGTGNFPEIITFFTLLSAAFLAIAVYKHKLFEINPAIAAENIVRIVDNYILLSDDKGIIKSVNPAACEALGFKEKDLIEKEINTIFMEGFIPDVVRPPGVSRGLLKPVKNIETRLKTASGTPLYVLLSASGIFDNIGVFHGNVIAATDITKRIALENAIMSEITKADMANAKLEESNRKLQELDRLKKNFIAMVSHELRTPLTSIKGFLAFLSHGVGGGLSEKQREFTDTMNLNVEKLLKLINELLDFSKIDSGTFSVEKKPSDLARTAKKAVAEMLPIAAKKHIKIVNLVKEPSLPGIFDEIRIGQVIINLLNNAVKYTYGNTSVYADASTVFDPDILVPAYLKTAPAEKGRYYLFSVRDEGPGMDPKYCQKIFDQFYQIEDVNTRKHEGVGLGLNISMNIIKAHNGFIWAESGGKDTGASFYFLIPAGS